MMEIKKINHDFSVCKVADYSLVNLNAEYCFIGKTDEEKSLVCITGDVPANVTQRDDGWKGFRIQGILDFSLIGILYWHPIVSATQAEQIQILVNCFLSFTFLILPIGMNAFFNVFCIL